jgi:hypothetical protein
MLVVHHRVYRSGKMAWEYGDDDLLTLCERCHSKLHDPDRDLPALLQAGEFYPWSQLASFLGFRPTPYLTNANGTIVCGAFRKDSNPDAPAIVLPGVTKKHWAESAMLLCKQRKRVPVFTKEAGLPWEYHGLFRGESYTRNATEIAIHQKRAVGRTEPVPLVLFLEKSV